MDQVFCTPKSLQSARSSFRKLFARQEVSIDALIRLIEALRTGRFDGRTSSECVLCHLGRYMIFAESPSYRLKTVSYVFSERSLPARFQPAFLKSVRYFRRLDSKKLEAIQLFASHIHMGHTPVNNQYSRKLLQWLQEALQQKKADELLVAELSDSREFSLC